jgi:HEAT repeat protein
VELLVAALRDEDREVRRAAMGALKQIGNPAVEPLVATLRDENSAVRRRAVQVLTSLGWAPVNDTQRAWHAIARGGGWKEEEVVRLGAAAVEPLMAALKDSASEVRVAAAQALIQIGNTAVAPLATALQEEEPWVRWAAAQALGLIGDTRAVEPLMAALKDSASEVRRAAAGALGLIDVERALILIVRLATGDSDNAQYEIRLLQRILERFAARLASEDLRVVAQLNDVVQWREVQGCNERGWIEETVDCSYVRQLARQELIRRGLLA